MRLRPLLFMLAIGFAVPRLLPNGFRCPDPKHARRRSTAPASSSRTPVPRSHGAASYPDSEAVQAGYKVIKALNRYDCRNGSFSTIKRVYLDRFASDSRRAGCRAQVMTTAPRSVDERLWYEVCKPPSVDELQKVAAEAGRAANPDMEPGATRHADYRPVETETQPEKRWSPKNMLAHPRRAADTHAEPSAPRPPLIKLPPPPPAAQPAPPPAAPAVVEHTAPKRAVRSRPARKLAVAHPAPKPDFLPAAVHHEVHWDYSGPGGPDSWGSSSLNSRSARKASGSRRSISATASGGPAADRV